MSKKPRNKFGIPLGLIDPPTAGVKVAAKAGKHLQLASKDSAIVPTVVSDSGITFYLLRDVIIERTPVSPWIALRSQFKYLDSRCEVRYFVVDFNANRGSPVLANSAAVYSDDRNQIGIGCQLFTGENARKLRRWAAGYREPK